MANQAQSPPLGSISRLASYTIFRPEKDIARKGRRQSLRQEKVSVVTEHHRGRFFAEARPVLGNIYFPASTASVCVVVALYNEVGPELSRTIESLTSSGVALDIVVVADGLAKLSGSMRQYLTQMFELQPAALLNPDSHVWGSKFQTFISEPVSVGSSDCKVQVLLKKGSTTRKKTATLSSLPWLHAPEIHHHLNHGHISYVLHGLDLPLGH